MTEAEQRRAAFEAAHPGWISGVYRQLSRDVRAELRRGGQRAPAVRGMWNRAWWAWKRWMAAELGTGCGPAPEAYVSDPGPDALLGLLELLEAAT